MLKISLRLTTMPRPYSRDNAFLIARLLRAAQEDNPAEVKVPTGAGAWRPLVTSVAPGAGTPERNQLAGDVCFRVAVWDMG